ncbi:hypothetical protein [Streptomyces sp. NPDC097610]|uniref:hypothetical protein n=1 Tax=Streptomyces sp. NPDC097610 TaxID=3157227 RepID=UPI00332F3BB1
MYVHTGDCWNAGKRSKGITRSTRCARSPRAARQPARTAGRTPRSAFRTAYSGAARLPCAHLPSRHALQEGEGAFDLPFGDLDRLGEQFAVSC